ncbi:MAG: radical SAM protein [Myxococcota bacterium]
MDFAIPERLSLELTRRCRKACAFCYNGSGPVPSDEWRPEEVATLVQALQAHGLRALSLGGGEPLEYEPLDALFEALRPMRSQGLFVSMTTNGLLLDGRMAQISRLAPDKVHVSIHFPKRRAEVERVIRQVLALRRIGLVSGVNLLVRRGELEAARACREQLWSSGIDNRAIVYLPMRGSDTPLPSELADVAGEPFQSMTCLTGCARSPRFVSLGADRTLAHCSYTQTRRRLRGLTAEAFAEALSGLGLAFCGDQEPQMVAQQKRALPIA